MTTWKKKQRGTLVESTPWKVNRNKKQQKSQVQLLHRVKRRLAFLVAYGRSNKSIGRELDLGDDTLTSLIENPEVQSLIEQMTTEIMDRAERQFQGLYLDSIRSARTVIRNVKGKNAQPSLAIDMIRMLWQALGKLPVLGKGNETNILNQQLAMAGGAVPLTDQDAQNAMRLLRQDRESQRQTQVPNLEGVVE